MNERYRLTRLFSHGGMAEVYLGTAAGAEGFEKPVAIKRVLPHLGQNNEIARMFVAEAKLATHLSHQNIVHVFDVGRGPDGLFIVMELVDGWDLGVIIDRASQKGQALSPTLAAFVASQVLSGLCHAYRQTHQGKRIIIAHRDLSPSNILISAVGEVKVADFGIARLEASPRTEPGTFKGKIAYSAPEALRGEPATVASDQFSLGIVLHEMLSGSHPFGRFENAVAYANAIANTAPAVLKDVPSALGSITLRAMSKSPSDRFESPEAFAKALSQFLASTGTATSTHELADFLRSLELPPPPSKLRMQDTVVRTGPIGSSFSLQHVPSVPQADFGPLRPPSTGLEQSAANSESRAPVEETQDEFVATGPSLDLNGKLDKAPPPAKASEPRGKPRSIKRVEPPLELAVPVQAKPETSAPPERLVEEPPPRPRRPLGFWVKWGCVACAAAALFYNGPDAYFWIADRLSRFGLVHKPKPIVPHARVLTIESEPPGATIQIGDEQVGQTPLYIDNFYPKGEIQVSLKLKGYQPWRGTFSGGEAASLKAQLKKRTGR